VHTDFFISFPAISDEDSSDTLSYELIDTSTGLALTIPNIYVDAANSRIVVDVDSNDYA